MHLTASATAVAHVVETANDRFKQGSAWRTSRAMVVAVAMHFMLFGLWPQMSAGTITRTADDLMLIPPPDVDIPPPPDQLARPAAPVIGDFTIDDDVTVPSTTEVWQRPMEIAPPPAAPTRNEPGYDVFVPSMVAPRLLNQREVQQALRSEYPELLRNAGIGGSVEVHLWVDERGTITRAEIGTSSGQAQLDEAALRVVKVMKLSPALNRGAPVRVIVALPVQFNVR